MIGKLRGIVENVTKDGVLLDVNGVGYIVYSSFRTLQLLPAIGEAASLWIETHVREDHIHLYGFSEQAEQECFLALITVNGVGAKVALSVLSVLSPDALVAALSAQDKKPFLQVNGVGPKLAERIILELKSKVFTSTSAYIPTQLSPIKKDETAIVQDDAISALSNLGYGKAEAQRVVGRLLTEHPHFGISDVIRAALQMLSSA